MNICKPQNLASQFGCDMVTIYVSRSRRVDINNSKTMQSDFNIKVDIELRKLWRSQVVSGRNE